MELKSILSGKGLSNTKLHYKKMEIEILFQFNRYFSHVNNYKQTEILSRNLLPFLKTLFSYCGPVVKHGEHRMRK